MLTKAERKVINEAYRSGKAYDDLVTLWDRFGGLAHTQEEVQALAESLS